MITLLAIIDKKCEYFSSSDNFLNLKCEMLDSQFLYPCYNSPFKSSHSHPIHTCLATIACNDPLFARIDPTIFRTFKHEGIKLSNLVSNWLISHLKCIRDYT